MPVKLILVLAFALVVALFAIQNSQAVEINLLGLALLTVPLSALIIGMLAIGVLLGVAFSAPGFLGKSRKVRELEAEIKRRDEEQAKQAPIAEQAKEQPKPEPDKPEQTPENMEVIEYQCHRR